MKPNKQINQNEQPPLKRMEIENHKYMGPTYAKDSNEYNMKSVSQFPYPPWWGGRGGGGGGVGKRPISFLRNVLIFTLSKNANSSFVK